MHDTYARWINEADSGRARALMESAFADAAPKTAKTAPRKRAASAKSGPAPGLKRVK